MASQRVSELRPAPLDEATVRTFQARLRGDVLRPADAGYDLARRVFNALIDKRPALIVRCAQTADVVAALAFARAHDLPVAVRGGGHNVAGHALCDGGLVVDFSRLKGIRVDPAARAARAEPGLTWAELCDATQTFGLAATGGFVGTTGVAGLTLGGGVGWLLRKHGLACDNLVSAEVVTADGRVLTASETEHPELFWGLRGGGGNFGVVTAFAVRLHPAGTVLAGSVIYPFAQAAAVLRRYRDFAASAPGELTSGAFLLTAPDLGPVVALGAVYCGDPAAGEAVVRPLRACGRPLADRIRPMPYATAQTMVDAWWPHGLLNYWKSSFLPALGDGAIEAIVAHFAAVPSPRTVVTIEQFGGAMRHVAPGATAFAQRGWDFNVDLTSMWTDPTQTAANVAWTRAAWEALRPFVPEAVYVNYLGVEGEERVRAAYGANYDRLVALKKAYDPTNVFRLNQNIPPTAGTRH